MNRWTAAAVLAVGLGAGLAAPASRAELPPHGTGKQAAPRGKKLEIAFTGAVMTINGTKFTLPADEADLVAVLGKPDRRAPLANTILTWDELGVFAYLKAKTSTCHAFAITIGKDTLEFWPKKPFSGRLTVDGAELRGDSDLDAVNGAKKGKPFKADDVLTDVWTIDHKEGSLYLRRSPTAKNGFIKLELGIPSG